MGVTTRIELSIVKKSSYKYMKRKFQSYIAKAYLSCNSVGHYDIYNFVHMDS